MDQRKTVKDLPDPVLGAEIIEFIRERGEVSVDLLQEKYGDIGPYYSGMMVAFCLLDYVRGGGRKPYILKVKTPN